VFRAAFLQRFRNLFKLSLLLCPFVGGALGRVGMKQRPKNHLAALLLMAFLAAAAGLKILLGVWLLVARKQTPSSFAADVFFLATVAAD